MDIISISYLVGFFGDASLQILSKYKKDQFWGLKPYFNQHGSIESMFIAGGMLAFFYIIFLYIFVDFLNIPLTWYTITIYAIILDLLFRKLSIFKSLDSYYKNLNYFWTAFWAIIPMLIPYFIYIMLSNQR